MAARRRSTNTTDKNGTTSAILDTKTRGEIEMNRSLKLVIGSITVLLMLIPPLGSAQENEPTFLDVRIMQVKSGRGAEFQELIGRVASAIAEAGRPPMTIWQEERGALATYHLVTPRGAYGEFDENLGPPIAAGEWANLISRLVDTVDSQRRILVRNYPNLGITAAEGSAPPEFLRLRLREIAWGGNAEYIAWLQDDLVPALADAGVEEMGVGRIVEGDSPRIWILSRPFSSWAELDQPGAFAELSEREIEQIVEVGNALTLTGNNLILRHRADLMAQ